MVLAARVLYHAQPRQPREPSDALGHFLLLRVDLHATDDGGAGNDDLNRQSTCEKRVRRRSDDGRWQVPHRPILCFLVRVGVGVAAAWSTDAQHARSHRVTATPDRAVYAAVVVMTAVVVVVVAVRVVVVHAQVCARRHGPRSMSMGEFRLGTAVSRRRTRSPAHATQYVANFIADGIASHSCITADATQHQGAS